MKTRIYKYFFLIMATLAAKGLAAQSKGNVSVPFKEIYKSGAIDNFTIREIKKKELQIAPSKVVALNRIPAINKKNFRKNKMVN